MIHKEIKTADGGIMKIEGTLCIKFPSEVKSIGFKDIKGLSLLRVFEDKRNPKAVVYRVDEINGDKILLKRALKPNAIELHILSEVTPIRTFGYATHPHTLLFDRSNFGKSYKSALKSM
jgi:hypothetical protein